MKKLRAAAAILLMTAAPNYAKTMTIGISMALFDDNFLTSVRQAMADHAVTDAGIPLVYVNRRPDAKTLPPKVSVVASDDLVAGRLEMTELARRMGGKGNVMLMLGDLANNSTQGRTASNKEVPAKNPGITVVEEQTANFECTKAIDLITNWLSKGAEINAVVCNNDEMAIGAIIALRQVGVAPKQVFVGGVDATPDVLAKMQKGNLAVTVFQDAKGQESRKIENAVKLAWGKQFNFVPYELVTPENYKTFLNR